MCAVNWYFLLEAAIDDLYAVRGDKLVNLQFQHWPGPASKKVGEEI